MGTPSSSRLPGYGAPVSEGGALEFAERVMSLVESGRKSATYKLATLLALIDCATEATDPRRGPPHVLHARRVGERVVELYWPQTVVYGLRADRPSPLRQSPQNDIPAKLARWRERHGLTAGATLADARQADPGGWDDLAGELIAVVIGMPLAKLQRFGEGRTAVEDRFIYDFSWRDEVGRSTVDRPGFDDRLHLRRHVGEWLVQLAPLLRPVIQTKWASLVARQNPDLVDAHQLEEFLFGAIRISLEPVRHALVEVQAHRCFYCTRPMSGEVEVDHFVPWSRHPDNTLDNLVAAHRRCNNAKSASIAGYRHLQRWAWRLEDGTLDDVATTTSWPRRTERTLGSVVATYQTLPPRTLLWVVDHDYEQVDATQTTMALGQLARASQARTAAVPGTAP
jgi:5-methylcytosine-specific restriction endonuclease McrA